MTACPGESNVRMENYQTDEPSTTESSQSQQNDWKRLVEKIQAGLPEGMEELYQVFGRGVRFYLYRQLGPQDLEDKVHDTFLIVLQAIRNGDLREPERLMGFVRTVVRRHVASHIDTIVHNRREHTAVESGVVLVDKNSTPEEDAVGQQRTEIVQKVLGGMSSRDREILTRFYLQEQTQEQICHEMRLTQTQFRLLKSRAKARFGELGRRRLEKKPSEKFLMRDIAGPLH